MAEAEVDARARATADDEGCGGSSNVAEDGQPAAAKGGATISVTVVLLALLVASVAAFLTSSLPRAGDVDGEVVQGAAGRAGEVGKRAEPVEHAVGIPGFNSRLDAFRTWAALTWMKLRRPRCSDDEPRYDDDDAAGSLGDAAKKSFEMGKETVEQAAAATARVTRDAAETAKEKVKGIDDAEL